MSKYEFVISAQDKTAQAFTAINSKLGTVAKHAAGTAAAVAGVTAAFGAFVVSSANNAKELEAQARLAGLNVEEFQSLSYAFGMFNIEQEKFADISKDVQDTFSKYIFKICFDLQANFGLKVGYSWRTYLKISS